MSISSLNDIKKGMMINYEGQPCIVLEARFLRMQQRKPVMQTKLKNIITGKVVEYSFKAGETVTEADVERTKANFLYSEDDKLFLWIKQRMISIFLPRIPLENILNF